MTKRYHADLPSWIFIGGISCLPGLLFAAQVYDSRHPAPATLVLLTGTLGFAVFALTWLAAFRIELTPTEVTYRSLFSGTQNIRTDQIKQVRLHRVYSTSGAYSGWQSGIRLIIEPHDDTSATTLDINAKIFSRAAANAILTLSPENKKKAHHPA
jgi:hypothetical protein